MLIVFGGLPGTGKSTIARLLALRSRAVYIRIDSIEQALRAWGTLTAGVVTEGYAVSYRVAKDNLRTGGTVIADSVNPLAVTRGDQGCMGRGRKSRRRTPGRSRGRLLRPRGTSPPRRDPRDQHPGLALPTWDAVRRRECEAWTSPTLLWMPHHGPPKCVWKGCLLHRRPRQAHHDLLTFAWELRTGSDGQVIGAGSDLLTFDASGRIHSAYRFGEPVLVGASW